MPLRKIAIPSVHPGGLEAMRSGHFGHCDLFTMVHLEDGEIREVSLIPNAPHAQGGCQAPVMLLQQNGADALIVGGIGMRPLMGFRQVGIDVYFDQVSPTVGEVVNKMIRGDLSLIRDTQTCGGGGGAH